MDLPKNHFKARLKAGESQIGIWNSIPGPIASELLAHAGYDWVVVDTEHSPAEVVDTLPALQALAGAPHVSAVTRPFINDSTLIKRHLDQGSQTLLIPYVQSADEARAAVSAMRYPPRGMRGVAGLHRASRYGAVEDYIARAEEELCLIVQIETGKGLDALEEIAAVEGVDGIFVGPADLSASLGYPGRQDSSEARAEIDGAIDRILATGKPAGILTTDPDHAAACIERGTTFTAVGLDLGVLSAGVRSLRARFG